MFPLCHTQRWVPLGPGRRTLGGGRGRQRRGKDLHGQSAPRGRPPASPPPGPRERPPCPLPAGTEVEWPRSGASIPTGSKPLCLTGSLRGRRPDQPSDLECLSPGPGRSRPASRSRRPSWPFPLRAAPTFPARGCAGAASHTGRGRAAAGAPPRSSRRSAGDSLYLRVSQPQNGAEGGNQAPPPAPPRLECAPPRARRRYPAVAHSPETRLYGASSVTAPGASGEKRRGEAGPARSGRRAAERQRHAAAAPRPSAEARTCPVGALQAQPGRGGKRPERRAGPRGRRLPARHLGTAAAAGHARRGHLRLQRGLGGGIRADKRVIGSWLYSYRHRMLPRAGPDRGDSSFSPKRPSL